MIKIKRYEYQINGTHIFLFTSYKIIHKKWVMKKIEMLMDRFNAVCEGDPRFNISDDAWAFGKSIREDIDILDEITSNLDSETEKLAIDLIDKDCKGTLMVISHHGDFSNICHNTICVINHKFIQYDNVKEEAV